MIIGHQKQWQFLKRSAELGKLSHAYLFCGQENLGKKNLAFEFAKLIVGQNIPNPDLILIEPAGEEIQISQIRDLVWKLSLRPYLAPFKIAVVDQAHLMNSEAQNCFLKTLEEPKDKTILILITEYPEILFPTILSRCEIIKFYPVPEAEIKNYLESKEIPEEKIQEMVKISQGRPGVAVNFVSNPQKLENQKQKIKELIKILNSDLVVRFNYAKDLSQNLQEMREALIVWLLYFRNILLSRLNSKSSSTTLIQRPEKFKFGFREDSYSFEKLKNNLDLIQRTNFLISVTNINPRLALENLMLEL